MDPLTSSDSATSIKLEWDEPCSQGAPIIGYRVQRGDLDAVVRLGWVAEKEAEEKRRV